MKDNKELWKLNKRQPVRGKDGTRGVQEHQLNTQTCTQACTGPAANEIVVSTAGSHSTYMAFVVFPWFAWLSRVFCQEKDAKDVFCHLMPTFAIFCVIERTGNVAVGCQYCTSLFHTVYIVSFDNAAVGEWWEEGGATSATCTADCVEASGAAHDLQPPLRPAEALRRAARHRASASPAVCGRHHLPQGQASWGATGCDVHFFCSNFRYNCLK